MSSIGDVSGSVRFSTNDERLADGNSDFSEGVDNELNLADSMPTEDELGDEREESKTQDLADTIPDRHLIRSQASSLI